MMDPCAKITAVHGDRPKRRTVAENDARILDAAVRVLDEFGVDGVTARRVADRAGLSTGAVYGRFESVDEVLVAVWLERLRTVVHAGLMRSIHYSDPAPEDRPSEVPESFDPVAERLGALFIALAPRHDVLAEVICPEVDGWFHEMGIGPDQSADRRARRGAAIAAYFGAMLNSCVSDALNPDWGVCLRWWDSSRINESPLPPRAFSVPSSYTLTVNTGNDENNALIASTAAVIARSGVAGTTLTRIARHAGLPRTAVYSHYDSRDELVRETVFAMSASEEFVRGAATALGVPHGMASAATFFLDPSNRAWRRRTIEPFLAADTDEALAATLVRAMQESEALLVRMLGPADLESQYVVRQLWRFISVLALGSFVVPEVSSVFEGIDWRIALSPIVDLALVELGDYGSFRTESEVG